MPDAVHGAVLKQLTRSLEAVETQIAQEPIAREVLEDFKMAVDQIRLSTWAVLTSQDDKPGSRGSRGVIAQFRVARANELHRHLRADLEAGLVPPDSEELREFRASVEDLANLVRQYVGCAV